MANKPKKPQSGSFLPVQSACSKCPLAGTTNCTMSSPSAGSWVRCTLNHLAALPRGLWNWATLRLIALEDDSKVIEGLYYRASTCIDVLVNGKDNVLELEAEQLYRRCVQLEKTIADNKFYASVAGKSLNNITGDKE